MVTLKQALIALVITRKNGEKLDVHRLDTADEVNVQRWWRVATFKRLSHPVGACDEH